MSELFVFPKKITSPHNSGSLAIGVRLLTDTPAATADSESRVYRAVEFDVTDEYGKAITVQRLQENGITVGQLIDWILTRGPGLLERFASSLMRVGWYSTVITYRCEADKGHISLVLGFAHPKIAHHLGLPKNQPSTSTT